MKYSLLYAAGLCLAISGCNQSGSNENYKDHITDSIMVTSGSSSAAVENSKDSVHQFIRTADLKFKVENVETATYKIEDITNHHGGFVTFTHLESNVDDVSTTAISADSILETTHFTVTNSMTIRVPNTRLDTMLKDIAKLVDWLDDRTIKADDISLQVQSNQLAQKRLAENQVRVKNAIRDHAKKLSETDEAESGLLDRQEAADNALLSNISLVDQVRFSTIVLSVYQRQATRRELIAGNNNTDAYEPGFGTKIAASFRYGLDMLQAVFVSLVKLWEFFFLGLIAWFMYRKYGYLLRK